jgi:thiol-disulfide isomerase/thioredoxin
MCPGKYSPRYLLGLLLCGAMAMSFFAPPSIAGADAASAYDLNGRPVDPLKASGGKVVVLLFVRTDCPVSNRYAPTIQRLSAAFDASARFWLVYPDGKESVDAIRAHDRQYRYNLDALRDPDHFLVKKAGAVITPEAAVFAADGRLVYHGRIDNWFVDFGRKRSSPTTHELKDAIEAAISGHPSVIPSAHAVGCYIADVS